MRTKTMVRDRQGALLSKSQRKYLTEKGEYEDSHSRAIRGRIRERVENTILDFILVDKYLEERDRNRIFDLDTEATVGELIRGDVDLKPHRMQVGLIRMIAFIYRACESSDALLPFEELVYRGIAWGESDPDAPYPTDIDVTIDIDRPTPVHIDAALEKLDEVGPDALSENELRAFAHFANDHPDVSPDEYRDVYQQERKKRAEGSGVPEDAFGYDPSGAGCDEE